MDAASSQPCWAIGATPVVMRRTFTIAAVAAITVTGLYALSNVATAQSLQGPAFQAAAKDFQFGCAACHGRDGKGEGPLAAQLKTEPPDLTQISGRRGGQFPAKEIYQRIEGLTMPAEHGTREMPIWGAVFLFEELGSSVAKSDAKKAEQETRRRLEQLVEYLRAIQE